VLGSNSGFASPSESNSASGSLQNNIEIHAKDTSIWIILNAQVNMLSNAKAKASSVREIPLPEFSILHLQSSIQDLVGFVTSDGDMGGNLLIPLDAEASDSVLGSGWDWFLSGEIFEDLAG
jgi:hypothetical protein